MNPEKNDLLPPTQWPQWAPPPAPLRPYIAIDLETSGLDESRCCVLQIGAFCLATGESFNRRIMPSNFAAFEEGAIGVSGYSRDTWKRLGAIMPSRALIELFLWLEAPEREHATLIAHNAPFDRAFLNAMVRRYRLEGCRMADNYLSRRWKCTQGAAHALALSRGWQRSDLGFDSLDRVAAEMGLCRGSGDEHDAAEDAELCARAWVWIVGQQQLQQGKEAA